MSDKLNEKFEELVTVVAKIHNLQLPLKQLLLIIKLKAPISVVLSQMVMTRVKTTLEQKLPLLLRQLVVIPSKELANQLA